MEDLDSKANFDIEYIYKITSQNGGFSVLGTYVSGGNIYIFVGATNCYISATNRRATSTGHVVSKILKQKVWYLWSHVKQILSFCNILFVQLCNNPARIYDWLLTI